MDNDLLLLEALVCPEPSLVLFENFLNLFGFSPSCCIIKDAVFLYTTFCPRTTMETTVDMEKETKEFLVNIHFPEEIIIEILRRLPVRILMQFKLV